MNMFYRTRLIEGEKKIKQSEIIKVKRANLVIDPLTY